MLKEFLLSSAYIQYETASPQYKKSCYTTHTLTLQQEVQVYLQGIQYLPEVILNTVHTWVESGPDALFSWQSSLSQSVLQRGHSLLPVKPVYKDTELLYWLQNTWIYGALQGVNLCSLDFSMSGNWNLHSQSS